MSQAGIIDVEGNNPQIPTQFDADVGFAIPIANILNIVGGVGITTTALGNTVTIDAVSGGFTWNTVTSATNPNNLVTSNGYITAGVAQVNFVLPAAAAIGDMFKVTGLTSLFQIQQNAGQQIILGSTSSTIGVGGSLTSLSIGDDIEITCLIANTTFKITDSMGNLVVV